MLSSLRRNKTGPILVSAQVALTLAVLVNVAFIVHDRFVEVTKPTGLDLDNMFSIWAQSMSSSYNHPVAVNADLEYLNSLPDVAGASITNNLPQSGWMTNLPFAAKAEALQVANGGVGAQIYFGTDRYLDALGLTLIAGRTFDREAIRPPAAGQDASLGAWADEIILTRTMAARLFPKGDALGKRLYVGLINKSSTVIGIVEDFQAVPAPARYASYVAQNVIVPIIAAGPDAVYIVRTKPGRRTAVMEQLKATFADRQPGRFVAQIEDMNHTAGVARSETRASAFILAIVAVAVLVVTVIGIGGLAAFNVTMRTRQLGIRRAIGARRFHIMRYYLVENWIITTSGALLGCVLAVLAGLKLSTLYEMERPPLYYLAGGVLLMWVLGLLAVLVPARRAASISPAIATRSV